MEKNKIRLNKNFYDIKSIKESIESFKDICNVKISEDKDYYDLEIKEIANLKNIPLELCNYILGTIKNNR